MFRWLENMGADLIATTLQVATLIGCVYLGVLIAQKTGETWAGWLAGIAASILAIFLVYLSIDLLQRHACRDASDFEECMDPPEEDY